MKILIIHNKYKQYGGEDRVVNNEILLLRSKGHTVLEYYRDNKEIDSYNLLQKAAFVFNSLRSAKSTREVEKLIKKEKPDLAHVHNVWPLISPWIYITLKKHHIPIVQTIHNFRFICTNGYRFIKGSLCDRCRNCYNLPAVYHRCYKNSFLQSGLRSLVLTISQMLKIFHKIDGYIFLNNDYKKLFIQKKYSAARSFLKQNFINVSDLRPAMKYADYIVYVGRLSPEKGVDILLEALSSLPRINLKIIGTGEEEKKLKSFVKKHKMKNIEFLGFQKKEKCLNIIKKAQFSIIPSVWLENGPLTVQVSVAVGVPVVANKTVGLEEMIKTNITGILIPGLNSQKLAKAIENLFNNNKKSAKMRTAAGKDAEKRFGPELNYQMLVSIYKKVLRNKK